MRRVFLSLVMLLVLSSATFVQADPQGLREPPFPGGNTGEGDLVTVSVPGVGTLVGKAFVSSFETMSFYL